MLSCRATGDDITNGRDTLIAAIMAFLAVPDGPVQDEIRSTLEREVERAGRAGLLGLRRRLAATGSGWEYFPPDPLARRIHHVLADRLMHPDSGIEGIEHAAAVAGRPVVIVANHLSYADANVVEILFERGGAGALASRLTAMAGPKVYVDPLRRFSSLCFGTIRTPQNSGVSSDEAVMPPREVARAAGRSIAVAHERLALGDALLVFGEGTRSRTGAMQPMLPGVARYFEDRDALVLPVAITGTDAAFPVGDNRLHRVPLSVRIGPPIDAGILLSCAGRDRRLAMDASGLAVAQLLPAALRGAYGDGTPGLEEPRRVLAGARPAA